MSWCSDNYIVHGKGQEGQGGVNTGDAAEVLLAIDSIVEEASHSLGIQLMAIVMVSRSGRHICSRTRSGRRGDGGSRQRHHP